MTVLYGIPNCDTVKKARVWLQEHGAESEDGAVRLMCAQPSLIKRPVLAHGGRFYCGFQTALYEGLFG